MDVASALADVDVILFINFFQLFCFLWMNAVLQVGAGVCNRCDLVGCVAERRLSEALLLYICVACAQGIGIMIVAGAVADWYWTRPSFDPSVKEEEWTQHLEGARSFHGLPEGAKEVSSSTRRWLQVCLPKATAMDACLHAWP